MDTTHDDVYYLSMSDTEEILKELRELRLRISRLEGTVHIIKTQPAMEKLKESLSEDRLNLHEDLIEKGAKGIRALWEEFDRLYMHFWPVAEKVFPGILADLAKVHRFPDTRPPPQRDPPIPGKKD